MAKKSSGSSSKTKARSAITGRYVKKSYAKSHPKTTVSERTKPGGSPPGTKGKSKK